MLSRTMSRVSKIMRIGLVVLAVQMLATVASAQTPRQANDLLLLITERVDGGFNNAQSPTLHYWWAQPAAPNWSPSDKIIHEVLGQKKVGVLAPTGKVQISKIYRRPELSTANAATLGEDRKSTRLNSSHVRISYAVFCLKKKKRHTQ